MAHLNLGITHYKIGDYSASTRHLQKSLRIGVKGGWIHRQCFANIALGNVLRLRREFEKARRHLHTAYNQAQELGFPREEALALEFLGDVYRDDGKPADARRFYMRALAIGLKIAPEGDVVMEAYRRIGECLWLEGQPVEARRELDRALAMSRAQRDRFEEGVILRLLSHVARDLGQWDAARTSLDESVAVLTEIGARHEAAIALMESAELRLAELEQGRVSVPRGEALDLVWQQAMAAMDLFVRVDVAWWTARCRELTGRVAHLRAEWDAAPTASVADRPAAAYDPGDVLIHASRAMKDIVQLSEVFARSDEPVLITGETGTGKEVVARRVHRHSDRRDRDLVVVNVAAIPPTMFEREFFGHVRGAFSSADRDAEGYAARADGGTLFLDEIGELPLESQPKLLRLLQEGTYQSLGDPAERRSDLRLIAATNADLARLVAEGRFRADLYYRLRVLELSLPPMRSRREDVLPLMRHFLSLSEGRHVDLAEFFDRRSVAAMEAHDWPGNAREIGMVARRAHLDLQARGRVEVRVERDGEPLLLTGPQERENRRPSGPLQEGSDAAERARILFALEENGGNRVEAARALNIGRSTLYRRMTRLGIPTRRP